MSSKIVTTFRRDVHSAKELRSGLGKARARLPPSHFREVVDAMIGKPVYRQLFAPSLFPETFGAISIKNRLRQVSSEGEFLWTAAILRHFQSELRRFSELRRDFDEGLLSGDYSSAQYAVEAVDREFGKSIWLVKATLVLRQMSGGTSKQKEYLQEILDMSSVNPMIGYVAYYTSARIDENTIKSWFDSQTDIYTTLRGFGDWLTYHIRTYDMLMLDDPANGVHWEEIFTIIDRFETFIAMASLLVASEGARKSAFLRSAIDDLAGICDPRLRKLSLIFGDGSFAEAIAESIEPYDAYSRGDYDECISHPESPAELVARASLYSPSISTGSSIRSRIIQAMRDVLLCGSSYRDARAKLTRIAMQLAGRPESFEIIAFLDSEWGDLPGDAPADVLTLCSTVCTGVNPSHIRSLSALMDYPALLALSGDILPSSPTLLLQRLVSDEEMPTGAAMDAIPTYRRSKYLGHRAYLLGDMPAAIELYSGAVDTVADAAATISKSYLYRAMLKAGHISQCIDGIVAEYISAPDVVNAYPLEEILESVNILRDSSIDLAIAFSIAARQIDAKWYRDMSDVVENVLFEEDVRLPSELRTKAYVADDKLVHFLRDVCVPRVIEDMSEVSNQSEVDAERIKICQWLTEIDVQHLDQHVSEIRTITRIGRVAELITRLENGKIYVDETGILESIDERMRVLFSQYKSASLSSDQPFPVERISKQLTAIFGENAIATLKSPSSQSDEVLLNILHDYTSAFASHPAFGLDVHLSAAIRHGAFEGHLRRPFASYDLLFDQDSKAARPAIAAIWESRVLDQSVTEMSTIVSSVERLSREISETLALYRENRLRLKADPQHLEGVFDFTLEDGEKEGYLVRARQCASYDELIPVLSEFCWSKTEVALATIRSEMASRIKGPIEKSLTAFLVRLDRSTSKEKIRSLVDAITHSRTEFQASLAALERWFFRPTEFERESYDFELAIDVALKQIENCYVGSGIVPRVTSGNIGNLRGSTFDGIVECMFLILQNIVRHSGLRGPAANVSIDISSIEGKITISVSSAVRDDCDLFDLRKSARSAVEKYQHDTAMSMARQDVGSGLSKLWRTLQFVLKRNHSLSLVVTDDRSFQCGITFNDDDMIDVPGNC